ncbi:response regulator [Photobacterium phosphoreum]|uniref:response regulator n=1 Tax=Photobacterium phosphoreum TaxID=659 RepID=UPI000D15B1C3|nr:response regulator [Photobacterium phosphoreum]PSU58075.1 hypothetical protein CTM80_17250 [Photobacterium phosphoreum]
MNNNFKLKNNNNGFIFDKNNRLNIFNLLRLLDKRNENEDLVVDISELDEKKQAQISSSFPNILIIYIKIINDNSNSATLIYSKLDQKLVNNLIELHDCIQINKTLIFETNTDIEKENNNHVIKNARGAILLALIQDLLSIGKIDDNLTFFDEKSKLTLHSASTFLYNKENAEMTWNILKLWEENHEINYRKEINKKINQSLRKKNEIESYSNKIRSRSPEKHLYFINKLNEKIGLPEGIFSQKEKINLWFIDDQQANGWLKLITSIIPSSNFDIEAFNSISDIELELNDSSYLIEPDIALVDLRLTEKDNIIETYNTQDLSGFKVVDLLLNKWSGLPIMITSASSKLWNMEKAIEKGAVAYWRKSDEIEDQNKKDSILIAFDIYLEFTEKLKNTLKRVPFKFTFKLLEDILKKSRKVDAKFISIQLTIEKYFYDLDQKTSWMCWKKCDDSRLNDNLYLGIMEIFNDIEYHLYNKNSGCLLLVPEKTIDIKSSKSDKQVINQTLEYLDNKYDIRGIGLESTYTGCKKVRNHLPIIHGNNIKDTNHADIIDIEKALLIIWCILNEMESIKTK